MPRTKKSDAPPKKESPKKESPKKESPKKKVSKKRVHPPGWLAFYAHKVEKIREEIRNTKKGDELKKELKRLRTEAHKAWDGGLGESAYGLHNVTDLQREKYIAEETHKAKKKAALGPRAKTAYFLFGDDYRKNHEAELEGVPVIEQSKMIKAAWEKLTDKELAPYEEKFEEQKAAYEKRREALPENLKRLERRRALTAYNYYVKQERPRYRASHPRPSVKKGEKKGEVAREYFKSVTRALGSQWKNLSEKERAPFVALAEADRARFVKPKVEKKERAAPKKKRAPKKKASEKK